MKRFWSKVAKGEGREACWLWTAAKGRGGYGVFQLDGKAQRAHRVAYVLAGKKLPKRKILLHKCDVRACVRPSHLRPGTQLDNVRDCIEKGRRGRPVSGRSYAGENNPNAKLSNEQIDELRRRVRAGGETLAALGREFGVTPERCAQLRTR